MIIKQKFAIGWSSVIEYSTTQGIDYGYETPNPYEHGSIYSTTQRFGSIGAKFFSRLAGGEGIWVWEWPFNNSSSLEIVFEVWEILNVFGFVAMEKNTTA